ncbi:molybdopterin-dependent oxidoreductase [Pseudonocardia sp. MCCB 268]|nr:molybdopterin-dependent oxidoreductase [Pseudonocardia cytotoxica]
MRVLRYVVAQDVGRAINPTMIEGQVHGGVAQGLGYALSEDLRIDDAGRVLDTGLRPTGSRPVLDVPPIDLRS